MTTQTTRPTDALLFARVSTDDFATPSVSLADRARIAAARPELADDMRVGTLRVYGTTDRAYIEMCEHTDPLQPDATVTRCSDVALDAVEAEVARMRDDGSIPGYLAAAALRDLRQ